jgi:hypothetical protein
LNRCHPRCQVLGNSLGRNDGVDLLSEKLTREGNWSSLDVKEMTENEEEPVH